MTTISQELERIAVKHKGRLRPADVVAFAEKHADSALHGRFDWDDTEAARKYRLFQARQIIRVNVTLVQCDRKEIKVRAFYSLQSNRMNRSGYRATAEVMGDDEMRAELLEMALADMKRFRAKYQQLQELARVFDAMEAAESKIAIFA